MAIKVDVKRAFVYLYFLGLVVLLSYLSFRNTNWLSGWDTLHPEFNFSANIAKLISGGWDESRGVGIVNGMAQVADLTRTLFLWGLSLVLPISSLRMIWIALMWLAGIIGVWKLFDDDLIGGGLKNRRWGGVIAGVFYLLNVGTVFTFYLPFEPFTSFFGILPWLLWGSMRSMKYGGKSDYLKLGLIYLLGASAFYVQTLFVVWVVVLLVIGIDGIVKFGGVGLRRFLIVLMITLGVNLYWLAPVAYFTLTQARVVGESAGNMLSTGQMQLINSAYGKFGDIAQMRGYLLSYISWMGGDKYGVVAQVWQEYLYTNYIEIGGYVLFGATVMGMLIGLFKKYRESLVAILFVISYLMLAMDNAPFGVAYEWLVSNIPLFGQIFRVPYTKWLPVYILVNSLGVGLFVAWICDKWKKIAGGIVSTLILVIIVMRIAPIFNDEMVSNKVRVSIPQEYFKLFDFMKKANLGRVAEMPIHSMWGWNIYSWGYEGSGFLWYGIEQSVLDRAFDVWSPYNEGFYNEFSHALYGDDKASVKNVLNKYDVRYVLIDESVIAPGQGREILRIEETKKMAEALGWTQTFKDGFLTVWDTGNSTNQFVSVPNSYTWVDGDTSKVREDVVYGEMGTYVSDNQKTQEIGVSDTSESLITYPFPGLMREEIEGVEYGEDKATLSSDHSLIKGSELLIPGWKVGDIVRINFDGDMALPAYRINGVDGPKLLGEIERESDKSHVTARVGEGKEWSEYRQDSRFKILDSRISIEVPGAAQIYDFEKGGEGTVGNCDVLKRGSAKKQGSIYIADERGAACDYIAMSELDTRLSYLMRIQGENREGRSVKFFLYNTGSKRNDMEYLLDKDRFDQTFSLLPWEWDGTYTLNVETRSFGQRAENTMKPVEVRWFPLEQIAGARIITPTRSDLVGSENDLQPTRSDLRVAEVKKTGTWLYRVKVEGSGLLRLSQGYDEGWISIGLPEHVKVDGWANGWMVPQSGTVTIFYWPQLLEYLGFGLLGLTMILLVAKRK